ncbi:MAG: PAS domain S-box protein [Bacteroidota bacterium]
MELKDFSKILKESFSGNTEEVIIEKLEKQKGESKRKRKQPSVHYEPIESSSDFEFLSASGLDFLNLPEDENIYSLIAARVNQIAEKAIVLINSFDERSQSFTCEAISGMPAFGEFLFRSSGNEIVGLTSVMEDSIRRKLMAGRLLKVEKGIHEISMEKIPIKLSKAIEKFLSIKYIYGVGFVFKGKLIASGLIFFQKDNFLECRKLMEAYIFQASVAIQHRNAEMQLRSSEARYRSIFENAEHVYYESDMNGILLDVSPSVYSYTKYKRADLIGRRITELFQSPDVHINLLAEIMKEKRMVDREIVLLDKDGKPLDVSLTTSIVYDEKNKPVKRVGFLIFITERKKVENELRDSEQKYRTMIEQSNNVVYIYDKDSFLDFSDNMSHFLEYSKDEFAKMNIWQLLHPDDFERVVGYGKARMNGQPSPNEYQARIMTKTGKTKHVEFSVAEIMYQGKPAIMGTAKDITERFVMLEALKESEEKYRAIVEQSNNVIYIYNKDSFLYFSDNMSYFLEYSREELSKMNIWQMLHPDDFERVVGYGIARMQGKPSPSDYQARIMTKSGKTKHVEFSVGEITYQGKPAIMGTAKDVTEREVMHDALRESEEKYRAIVEQSHDVIYIHDNEHFIFFNSKLGEVSGFSDEELREMYIFDIVHPRDRERLKDMAVRRMAGEDVPSTYTFDIIAKDGRTLHIHFSISMVDYLGKRCYLGLGRDITEEVEMQKTLHDTELRYRELIENANDIILTMDVEGKITSVNDRAAKLLGYNLAELGNWHFSSYLTPESNKMVTEQVRAILGGAPLEPVYEVEALSQDGDIRKFEVNVNLRQSADAPPEFFCIARDITERKKMMNALRDSEYKYRVLVENISDIVYLYDIKGNIIYVSPNVKKLFGFEAESLIGRNFIEFIHADDVDSVIGDFKTTIESKHGMSTTFRFINHKSGKEFHVEQHGNVILDPHGEVQMITGVIHDITQRIHSDQIIRNALKEKEVMLREIHHRVKNNMQIIVSLINMQYYEVQDLQSSTAFRDLQERVRSMALVHEFLYLSDDLANVGFKNFISSLVSNLDQVYRKRNDVKLKITVDDIYLDVERAIPLGLVINEIVTNSMKYAFPDGFFPASAVAPEIKIDFKKKKNEYHLIISDNGISFGNEIDIHDSKTLGLRLVSILTSQIKGKIDLKRDKGTLFDIKFS